MKKCLLSKDINECPFCNKDKMECRNETTGCGFQKCEEVNKSGEEKRSVEYVRKERWYEKYYKGSRPVKS